MAKRFFDTAIWDKAWFRKLSPELKCAWFFLCQRCDAAGVWEKDIDALNFFLKSDLSESDILDSFNTRIVTLEDDKWLLVGFISFQYGTLSEACKPHKSILKLIEKHGLKKYLQRVSKGYAKGMDTLQEKEKEKVQEKEKEKEKVQEKEKPRDPNWEYSTQLIHHWNLHGILPKGHAASETNVKKVCTQVKKRLENYSHTEIVKAVDNYAEALRGSFSYRWALWDFLKRENADKFFPDQFVRENWFQKKLKTKSEIETEHVFDLVNNNPFENKNAEQ